MSLPYQLWVKLLFVKAKLQMFQLFELYTLCHIMQLYHQNENIVLECLYSSFSISTYGFGPRTLVF